MIKIWSVERTREVLALADEIEAALPGYGSNVATQLRGLAGQVGTLPACTAQTFIDGGQLQVTCDRTDWHGHTHRAFMTTDETVWLEWT